MIMKKKLYFIVCTLLFAFTSLLTSCFSSGGEIEQPNVPSRGKLQGTRLDLNNTTYVVCQSEVLGLKGHAVVEKETAQVLANIGWDGILIILEECDDQSLTPVKEPDEIVSGSFKFPKKAQVIKASCFPTLVKFPQNPIKLVVETTEADKTSLSCSFNGMDVDTIGVTTDAQGAHVEIPHFSEWVFTLNFSIQYVETKTITSDELKVHCSEKNIIDKQYATYQAEYGYRTDVKNPFVLSFLKQYFGKVNTIQATHEYSCSQKPGDEVFNYTQNIYVCNLVSGSQSFRFEVYGKPHSHHIKFVSSDHDGGSGMNP